MARVSLNPGQSVGFSFGDFDVFGTTTGMESVTIAAGTVIRLAADFASGGDTIVLAGNAGDYSAVRSGTQIILTSGATSVTIPVGTTANSIQFADGARNLVINTTAGTIELGTQTIPTGTPVAVTPGSGGSAVVGSTFTLTTGVDTGAAFTGTAANDTFNATTTGTFQSLDSLNGGAGIDTLNVFDNTKSVSTSGVTVTNIETANLQSAQGVTANTTGFTGLTSLAIVSNSFGPQTTTAATTTAVTINNLQTGDVTLIGSGGAANVTNVGGIIVGGAPGAANANALTSVTTTGGTFVTINDNSGTNGATGSKLTSVSVANNSGNVNIGGNGVTALSVTNNAANNTFTTVNSAAGTRALNLTVAGDIKGQIIDNQATSLTVTSGGTAANTVFNIDAVKATSVTYAGDNTKTLTIDNSNFAVATSVTVNSAGLVSLTNGLFDTDSLKSVTVLNSGGFKANLANQSVLTAIDASASTGANTLSINGTLASYTGGTGADTVTLFAEATKAISGGAGTDTVVYSFKGTNAANALVTGFETLAVSTGSEGSYNATGFTGLRVVGTPVAPVTFTNVAAGTGLTYTVGNANVTYNQKIDTSADAVSVTLSSAGAIFGNSVNVANIETVNINLVDTNTTKNSNSLFINGAQVTSVVVTGNTGLFLGSGDTAFTSIDASAVTNTPGTANTGFVYTAAALTSTATIRGSSTGGDNIDAFAALKSVTITTFAGTNTVNGSVNASDSITGGIGADTINGFAGNDTIIGGGGADRITGGTGADLITLSGTTARIILAAGDTGANTSTTIQTSQLTSTFDIVTGVTAGTTLQLGSTPGITVTNNANLTGVDNQAVFARGVYDSAAGTFTYAANGADTALTYDTVGVGTAFETIILVGFVQGATTSIDGAGLITFG